MFQKSVMVDVGEWSQRRLNHLRPKDKKRIRSTTGSPFGRILQNWMGRTKVYPGNVLYLPTPNVFMSATESKNRNHSATFPVELPSWFIKLFTREGDIVLDPFLGSGTTAIAALRLRRRFIGMEIDKGYCKVAEKRIRKEIRSTSQTNRKNAGGSVHPGGN